MDDIREANPLTIKRRGDDGKRLISLRISEELLQKLNRLAVETNRSRKQRMILILKYGVENIRVEERTAVAARGRLALPGDGARDQRRRGCRDLGLRCGRRRFGEENAFVQRLVELAVFAVDVQRTQQQKEYGQQRSQQQQADQRRPPFSAVGALMAACIGWHARGGAGRISRSAGGGPSD